MNNKTTKTGDIPKKFFLDPDLDRQFRMAVARLQPRMSQSQVVRLLLAAFCRDSTIIDR